jgi:thioredoxin 1
MFKGGEPVQSVAGARPKGDLIKLIETAMQDR